MDTPAPSGGSAGGAVLGGQVTAPSAVAKLVLETGVQVTALFPGDGVNFPVVGNFIRVHYEVRLLQPDGSLSPHFDSSRARGVPFDFQLGAGFAVPGLEEALLRMSRGERALVAVPPARAFGKLGAPPFVPPGATLVFDVDLIAVQV